MRSTLAAVHANTIELLQFFASHSYTPSQAVSAALNKAAAHASMLDDGGFVGDLYGGLSGTSTGGDGVGAAYASCLCCGSLL